MRFPRSAAGRQPRHRGPRPHRIPRRDRRGRVGDAVPHVGRLQHLHGVAEGQLITVDSFIPGSYVKVTGVSKGKGYAGTIKRHNFKRGPKSHGSHNVRGPGSIGAAAYPARVFKGIRMSGHMGARQVTQRGLQVVDRDPERNILLVKGAVPGAVGSIVFVRPD